MWRWSVVFEDIYGNQMELKSIIDFNSYEEAYYAYRSLDQKIMERLRNLDFMNVIDVRIVYEASEE